MKFIGAPKVVASILLVVILLSIVLVAAGYILPIVFAGNACVYDVALIFKEVGYFLLVISSVSFFACNTAFHIYINKVGKLGEYVTAPMQEQIVEIRELEVKIAQIKRKFGELILIETPSKSHTVTDIKEAKQVVLEYTEELAKLEARLHEEEENKI